MKKLYPLLLIPLFLIIISFFPKTKTSTLTSTIITPNATPIIKIINTQSPTPSPKPQTLAQMNTLYGPCISLPVLMYHHIQDEKIALSSGYKNLNVTPDIFRKQAQYLKDKKYNIIPVSALVNYFSQKTPLPNKPILLTFDDGYADFYQYAFPILKEFNFPAVLFFPTGLANNPGYLTWSHISELAQNQIYIGNHTWSHRSMKSTTEIDTKEITTADTQLAEHGQNSLKVFAYPYGNFNANAQNVLTNLKYSLAFTTRSGLIQCAKLKYELPRIRIGNSPLSNYNL